MGMTKRAKALNLPGHACRWFPDLGSFGCRCGVTYDTPTEWQSRGPHAAHRAVVVAAPGFDYDKARFLAMVEQQSNGCWLWTGSRDEGYGKFWFRGRQWMAHCAGYELFVGPIAPGLQVDHLCHTNDDSCDGGLLCPHRSCVNPAHMEPVTPRENALRSQSVWGRNARKTHCMHGHPFDEANTRVITTSCGVGRACRACIAANARRYRKRAS